MGGLFSVPKPPPVPEPAVMPDMDDEAIRASKRKAAAATRARSGVLSTTRSSAGGTLGAQTALGGDYSKTALGG